jgi:Dual-action HEIGH metallo-peptidase
MKMNAKSLLACAALSTLLFSCQKQDKTTVAAANGIPAEVINQIAAKGFNTEGVVAVNGGYVVEGDIFLSNNDLINLNLGPDLRVGEEEQYRTTNLIKNLPRVITITVQGLDPIWTSATDIAIARYNALGMRLTFQRVASGGQVVVLGADLGGDGVLGRSSGFPDTNGNPPSPITLNNRPGTFGSNPSVNWLATIVAHEIGHTIGFRHTDYKNRKYSCGGIRYNEGKAGVGAVYIPGTPTGGDPNSWMLACTDGTDRPFNANDAIALNYLYH